MRPQIEDTRSKRRISQDSVASAMRCNSPLRNSPRPNAASTSKSCTCSHSFAPASRPASQAAGT
jgi:hypothetical protein